MQSTDQTSQLCYQESKTSHVTWANDRKVALLRNIDASNSSDILISTMRETKARFFEVVVSDRIFNSSLTQIWSIRNDNYRNEMTISAEIGGRHATQQDRKDSSSQEISNQQASNIKTYYISSASTKCLACSTLEMPTTYKSNVKTIFQQPTPLKRIQVWKCNAILYINRANIWN